MSEINSEEEVPYLPESKAEEEDAIIAQALNILNGRIFTAEDVITSPDSMKDYVRLKFVPLEHEVFMVVFLDNRHGVLAMKEMFRGTIDGSSVHPREVVKEALYQNAAACVFVHNHPSGYAEPSMADRRITTRLKEALALVEVRVLDHLVVGGKELVSFAERGLI